MRRSLVPLFIVLALTAAACGGDDASPVTTRAPANTDAPATTAAPATTEETATTIGELPPPDPADYTGSARVVNLYLDGDGNTSTVDVWGRRTFTSGPILLVEGIEFGEVSDYFAAPDGYSIDLVAEGTGPDGEEVGSLSNPQAGEQSTTLFLWDGEGDTTASLLFNEKVAPDSLFTVPEAPPAGTGLIILQANQLSRYSEDLSDAAFSVGTPGGDDCVPQSPLGGLEGTVILGGTQPSYHEVPPGTFEFTLHPWPQAPGLDNACRADPVHPPLTTEAGDGARTWVFLYTTDALETIEVLTVPWGE
jgi:hypothetical protein